LPCSHRIEGCLNVSGIVAVDRTDGLNDGHDRKGTGSVVIASVAEVRHAVPLVVARVDELARLVIDAIGLPLVGSRFRGKTRAKIGKVPGVIGGSLRGSASSVGKIAPPAR